MRIAANLALIAAVTVGVTTFAAPAFAETTYIGLSRATPGEAYADFPTAKHVVNYNSPLAIKLYGGLNLTDRYAVEFGYGAFGTWKIADPAPGSTDEVRSSSKLLYMAGRAGMPVTASVALFGKIGIAANRIAIDKRIDSSGRLSFVRPMLGFGVDYNITTNIAAVLEFNYYGAHNSYRQQKLELGLKYGF
jgi:opacity protein-like surface antigen